VHLSCASAIEPSRQDKSANRPANNAEEGPNAKYNVDNHKAVAISNASNANVPQQGKDHDQVGHYQPEKEAADCLQEYPHALMGS
jgi:hypothetical protein